MMVTSKRAGFSVEVMAAMADSRMAAAASADSGWGRLGGSVMVDVKGYDDCRKRDTRGRGGQGVIVTNYKK